MYRAYSSSQTLSGGKNELLELSKSSIKGLHMVFMMSRKNKVTFRDMIKS